MVELARQGGLLKSREISHRQEIPLKYLEQIFSTLKKNNLVKSIRGAEGGYLLTRPPQQITVYEILQALEGNLSATGRGEEDQEGLFWKELDRQIRSFLEIPLSDFSQRIGQNQNHIMYYI